MPFCACLFIFSTPIANVVAPQAVKGNRLLVLQLWTELQSYLVVRVNTVYFFCGGVFLLWCEVKLVEICPLSWGESGGLLPAVCSSYTHSWQPLLEAVPEKKILNESPAPQMHERLFPPASVYTLLYADRRTAERAVL